MMKIFRPWLESERGQVHVGPLHGVASERARRPRERAAVVVPERLRVDEGDLAALRTGALLRRVPRAEQPRQLVAPHRPARLEQRRVEAAARRVVVAAPVPPLAGAVGEPALGPADGRDRVTQEVEVAKVEQLVAQPVALHVGPHRLPRAQRARAHVGRVRGARHTSPRG